MMHYCICSTLVQANRHKQECSFRLRCILAVRFTTTSIVGCRLECLDRRRPCCQSNLKANGCPVQKGLSSLLELVSTICARVQVDRHKNQADLSLRELHSGSKRSSATAATSPAGTVLLGQVVTASDALVRVHVGRRTYGTVALTDIHDGWVAKPAEGISKGMYVRCCVVGKASGQEAKNGLQLSLQASKGGSWAGQGSAQQSPVGASVSAVTSLSQLKEGQQVKSIYNVSLSILATPTTPAPHLLPLFRRSLLHPLLLATAGIKTLRSQHQNRQGPRLTRPPPLSVLA